MLVQCQADNGSAVFLAKGQDGVQRILLTVDRVDDGLAVVDTQRAGKSLRIGGIELERQIRDGLQVLDKLLQCGGLVNTGQTGVDIQHLSTGLGLGYGLGAGIGAVTVPQSLLQPLFAGGIDALSYNGDAVHLDKANRRTQTTAADRDLVGGNQRGKGLPQLGDEVRRCAAAAANHGNADRGISFHLCGKFRGIQVVAAVRVGQTGIGLDKNRYTGRDAAAEPLCKRQNLLGTQRAVDAHGIGTETGGRDGVAFHRTAGKGAAAALKAHRGKDRQGAVFLGGENGRLQFIQIGHRFKKDKVRPGCRTGTDDLRKLGVGILKAQGAGRDQQLAQRADIQGYQRAGFCGGAARTGNRGRNDLLDRAGAACKLFGVGTKGVGQQNVRAGAGVIGVDGSQSIRHFQSGQLGLLPGLQAAGLQLGAHAAVQKDKALTVKYFTDLHTILPYRSCLKQVVPRLRNEQVSRRWQVAQPARVPVTG